MIALQWLQRDPDAEFPSLDTALLEPDGLLAAGGDLSPRRLIKAYASGIFPWYSEGEPILWWSPDPRFVLHPEDIKASRSFKKTLRKAPFRITMDSAFEQVIQHCSTFFRPGQAGTWITREMRQAYIQLHQLGHAHSVECWQGDELVGGLYGVHSAAVFCGESMFSQRSDASKVALFYLCRFLHQQGFKLIDSQVYTEHLERMGARFIPREQYIRTLQHAKAVEMPNNWQQVFAEFMSSDAG